MEGFDTEQIWGQLEASCGPALKQLRKNLKGLGPDFVLLDEETEAALDGERAVSQIHEDTSAWEYPQQKHH